MFYFVCFLRLLATALITNSHYADVWPVSAMACGGLLGNVIFFSVSGFCLYNVKPGFLRWYGKRFLKVYPIVAAFTLFTVVIGAYRLGGMADFIRLFVFPTNYVFIAWIVLLYVPFYFVSLLDGRKSNIVKWTGFFLVVVWIAVYLLFIDKSRYVVDAVESPFILFLYFASMLMGAWFRKNRDRFDSFKPMHAVYAACALVLYFGSKIVISRMEALYPLQLLNQAVLLLALAFVFAIAIELEDTFLGLDKRLLSAVELISNMTLHIYVVQFIVIRRFSGLVFPLNLIVVTALILMCAAALYYLEYYVRRGLLKLFNNPDRELKNNAEN